MHNQLGLYIHFPWCVKKCPYCDFNSHPVNAAMDQERYIDALILDFKHQTQGESISISSIFMGGGTPSLFDGKQMSRLLDAIRQYAVISDDCEITCEANPGAVDAAKFKDYHSCGINRISIGVQSFNDKYLKKIGRIHGSDDAHQAIASAKQAGFERINIDIMYALPDQSIEDAMCDLEIACNSEASHLSWYQLTFEPDTYFARFPPKRVSDDVMADMEQTGLKLLKHHNLTRYEISAYHKQQDQPCRHNMNYWLFGDYLAIGAGAHGKITKGTGVCRYHKARIPKQYLTNPTQSSSQSIACQDLLFECMMNMLRLFKPLSKKNIATKCGISIALLEQKIQCNINNGYLKQDNDTIQATPLGYQYLNEVVASFL